MKRILTGIIKIYQVLTCWVPHCCIYTPSCSSYMIIAIKKWGAFRGVLLGLKRILRCVPWKEGGLDPVPDNPMGPMKWLM